MPPAPAPATAAAEALDADRKVVDVLPGPDGDFEIALTQYESGFVEPAAWRGFEACMADVEADFGAWLDTRPAVPAGFEAARTLAAYVTWSAVVGPRGLLRRPMMLMSKNWMYAAWSWDHCFNAIGLAHGQPDLAWDQFMGMFDHQHAQGALPDILTDSARVWGCVKPPVHGWTLRMLDAAGVVTDERLAEIYPRLAAWTDWWTTYRDDDGLCQYFHGNDSGWDNATAFDVGFPDRVAGPRGVPGHPDGRARRCGGAPRPAGGGRHVARRVRTRCSPSLSRGCGTANASACRGPTTSARPRAAGALCP